MTRRCAPPHSPLAHNGGSDAPTWSALVVDGVTLPYEQMAGVRMDESALEFIVDRTRTAQEDDPPRQHLRMYTRSEFNLWREAFDSKITNNTLHVHPQGNASTSAGVEPTDVAAQSHVAAQKWLAHTLEDAAASCA